MNTVLEKGMSVIRQSERKMLLYNQFDLGDKYKIYVKVDGYWAFCYSSKFFGNALEYYDKIYDEVSE